jgi:hypothetical protein
VLYNNVLTQGNMDPDEPNMRNLLLHHILPRCSPRDVGHVALCCCSLALIVRNPLLWHLMWERHWLIEYRRKKSMPPPQPISNDNDNNDADGDGIKESACDTVFIPEVFEATPLWCIQANTPTVPLKSPRVCGGIGHLLVTPNATNVGLGVLTTTYKGEYESGGVLTGRGCLYECTEENVAVCVREGWFVKGVLEGKGRVVEHQHGTVCRRGTFVGGVQVRCLSFIVCCLLFAVCCLLLVIYIGCCLLLLFTLATGGRGVGDWGEREQVYV